MTANDPDVGAIREGEPPFLLPPSALQTQPNKRGCGFVVLLAILGIIVGGLIGLGTAGYYNSVTPRHHDKSGLSGLAAIANLIIYSASGAVLGFIGGLASGLALKSKSDRQSP